MESQRLNMANVTLFHLQMNGTLINWHEKFEGHSIDEMWNLFSEQYHESVNIHVLTYTPKKGCKTKPF